MAAMLGHVDAMEPRITAAEHTGQDEHEQFAPTSGTEGSLLVNVPALIALQRSYIAQLRGDADTTAALRVPGLAQLHDGEWMLHSAIQGFLAVAEWLRGRLSEASGPLRPASRGGTPSASSPPGCGATYWWPPCSAAQGRLDAADQTCRDAWNCWTVHGAAAIGLRPALVGLAQSAYQRDQLHEPQATPSKAYRDAASGSTTRP